VVSVAACAPPAELAIDLHTDLTPGVDFEDVHVSLASRPEQREPGAIPNVAALRRGVRLIEYPNVEAGADVVTVTLTRADGEPFVAEIPVMIDGPTAVTAQIIRRPQVIAGHGVSCARFGSRAWCWGVAGRFLPNVAPGVIVGPTEIPFEVIDMCSSYSETCFLDSEESLRCVRSHADGPSTETRAPHAGHGHVELDCGASIYNIDRCLRATDGTLSCNGTDVGGQLGDGPADSTNGLEDDARVTGIDDAREVTMGIAHVCARTEAGEIWCWGFNDGNCGDGTTQTRHSPVRALGTSNMVRVDSLWHTTCAVAALGRVWCWGSNDAMQIDATEDPVLTPTRMERIDGVRDIAVGEHHVCAVRDFGEIYCWGGNARGQLGDGTTVDRADPVGDASVAGAVFAIDAGPRHTCRITGDGGRLEVACWGGNTLGELGRDAPQDSASPVEVVLPSLYSQ
jgi:hypothetical protein